MKSLTKIKLINWHGFYNETINMKGATLFTGDNGCGKSSLIDAIYFLLTGGDDNKFNIAANDKAKRTLVTYMRGRTGTEGSEYIRNENDIISHIALEFYDNITHKSLIIGVVLEIQDSKVKVGKTFYHINDRSIEDNMFFTIKDNVQCVLNFRSMEKKLGKDNIKSLDMPNDSRTTIRKNIYTILQLGPRYYDLLPRAIAFKPIPDVNEFVYKFLMPERNIDIDNIRENIRTYNAIQLKIEQDKSKKEELEKIIELGNKFKSANSEKQLFEGYSLRRKMVDNKQLLQKSNQQIDQLNMSLLQAQNELKDYEEQIASTKETIYSLTHNESYLALRQIEDQLKSEEENKEKLKISVDTLNRRLLDEEKIAESLKISVDFHKYIKSKDFSAMHRAISAYKIQYDQSIEQLNSSIFNNDQTINKLIDEEKELSIERGKIQSGLPSYKVEVSALIDVIKNHIHDENNNPIRVTPFCEMLEIKDGEEEWRNAVEGYLNTRRFDLFVSEKYYDAALSLYEKYKQEKRIYGVGLVNIAKIKKEDIKNNSLASKVITESEDAQRYVNFLMGDVICVDSENDLKKFERSITKTVMVYQNKAARQTKKEHYASPYIGRKSSQMRLDSIKDRLSKIETLILEKSAMKNEYEALRRNTKDSNYALLINTGDVWAQYDKSKEAIGILKSKLLEAKKNNDIVPKVDAHNQLLSELEGKKENSSQRIIQLNLDINNARQKVQMAQQNIDQINPIIYDWQKDIMLWKQVEEFFANHNYSLNECNSKIDLLKREIESSRNNLIPLMHAYIIKFGFDANADMDSLDIFYREYNDVILRDLEAFAEKLEETKALASKAFQESYIAEVRSHIRDEKRKINKLNEILSNKPFGVDEEIYHFEVKRSADKNFGAYYDIFIGTEDYDIKDLFTEQLSDKNYKLMQDLFLLLTQTSQSEKQDALIREYTDYRKFMSYDIKITNKRNEVLYFSKINNEKSGGEIQTPFYVIIAASFDQILHNGFNQKSPGCIVMLDEAFNNMDGARISSLLSYFAELDIQPLISVPTTHSKAIMPYVSTIVALVKHQNRLVSKSHIRNR